MSDELESTWDAEPLADRLARCAAMLKMHCIISAAEHQRIHRQLDARHGQADTPYLIEAELSGQVYVGEWFPFSETWDDPPPTIVVGVGGEG